VAHYAATGLPPAYLPKDESQKDNPNNPERKVTHE
jgi:hypothetical protein